VPYPDGSLPRRLLENDREALGVVIRLISMTIASPRFWSLRPEWSDLVQEALAGVVESLRRERFDPARDFPSYVQGIARFACLYALRRKMASKSSGEPRPNLGAVEAGPEKIVIDAQLARRALDLATPECRDLFVRYYFDSQSHEQIAAALDIAIGTVKSRLFRCLERVQRAMAAGAP
jgi:RNA polymerase sigma-70 factor, ECF subfamily